MNHTPFAEASAGPSQMKSGRRDRIALVTGGTSGIGLAIAERLIADGLEVVVTGRCAQRAQDAVDRLGPHGHFHQGDLVTEEAAQAAVTWTLDTFGRLDVLVNNAGRRHAGTILDTPLHEIVEVFGINTFAVMAMTRAAARAMIPQQQGAIVNLSSRLASIGVPTLSTYSASKGAILAYTRAAAIELAPHGIRVNAVAPGMTKTPLIEDWLGDQEDPEASLNGVLDGTPLKRLATPEDVAAAVAFLASPDAAHITGASLPVDGGYTAQ